MTITESYLWDVYWGLEKPIKWISKETNISAAKISRDFRRYGVPTRHNRYAEGYPELHDKQWVYDHYITKNLSIHKIAKILGCSRSTVNLALHRHKLPVREPAYRWGRAVELRVRNPELAKALDEITG